MSDILHLAVTAETLTLTLNRPEARNALSRALIAELTAALENAVSDAHIRSVIITGTPPAFCSGLDLREVAQTTADQAEHDSSALLKLYETIDNLPKPVIAAVNGPAVAGGAGLLSVCDVAVAAESAVIGYPEIKRGLVAAIVMTYLRRIVGERQAKYLLLTGENLPARRALDFGLINEVVPDGKLLDRARHHAAMFAGYPAEALANTKLLWNRVRGAAHAQAVEEARKLNASMRLTAESRTGIGQFLDKRNQS